MAIEAFDELKTDWKGGEAGVHPGEHNKIALALNKVRAALLTLGEFTLPLTAASYVARTTAAVPAASSFTYEVGTLSVYENNGYGAGGAAVTITGRYFRNDSGLSVDIYLPNNQLVTFRNCVFATNSTSNMVKVNNNTSAVFDNCFFLNDNPAAAGTAMGRAIYGYEARSVKTTNCTFYNTGGCLFDHWSTQAVAGETLTWLRNRYINIRGGSGGDQLRSALQTINIYSLAGVEVAYNQVINTPGASRVEDNFNMDCSGTAASPWRLHHNFIRGAYPANPTDAGFTGTGWTTDNSSTSNPPANQPAYILAEYNYAVACMNACANIAAGHHITYRSNYFVVSGLLANGTKLNSVNNAVAIFRGQAYSDAQFDYNGITGNTIKVNTANGEQSYYPNSTNTGAGQSYPGPNSQALVAGNTLNTYTDGATYADEDAAFASWQQQLTTDKVLIGAALPQ